MTDITFELVEVLFKVSRQIKEELSFENERTHLSVLQFHTLMFLHRHPNATMGDIADYFQIELPSATSLITKMSDQHLVKRFKDPADRRLVKIMLTAKGQALFSEAVGQRRKKLEKNLNCLSDSEKRELLTILRTLHQRLQQNL